MRCLYQHGIPALDLDMKYEVLDFLNDLQLYEELTVNGKNFLLVHGGLGNFSLEIQRMPKNPKHEFGHVWEYPYRSVCTISTHDMSTLRDGGKKIMNRPAATTTM